MTVNRYSSKKFKYTENVRFYFSFTKKLISPLEMESFVIEGYRTTCFRCNRTGCITNQIITSIFYRKKNKSGNITNWIYERDLNSINKQTVDSFFQIFKSSPDFPFFKDILDQVEKDIYEFEMKRNEEIIHNSKLRLNYNNSTNKSEFKETTIYTFNDNYDEELENLSFQIQKLNKDILNLSSFESSFPEKSIRENLISKYNELSSKSN